METSFTDVRVSRVRSPCIVAIILIQVCNLKFEELLIYGAHKGKDSTGDECLGYHKQICSKSHGEILLYFVVLCN